MELVLETRSLTKYFRHQWTMRRFLVLDRIDLQVEPGQVFGLIGPNGAGKTTTFKCILGLLRPTSGTVTFCGEPLKAAARAGIGFLPEQPYFYDYLTVRETLGLYARLYGMSGPRRTQRINDIIEQLQLGHKARAPLRTLSKGTLQRVGIAQAILNEPRLVILDEPMSGLDPAGRKHMRELIGNLRRQGTTVIFSSHILPDAEALCQKVAILTGGRVREVIDLHRDRGAAAYDLAVRNVDYGTLDSLRDLLQAQVAANGDLHHVRLPNAAVVGRALDVVRQAGGLIESLTPIYPSLEERFLSHVGHDSRLD
jgi:ABC-2 type transport system ATP-binding protein